MQNWFCNKRHYNKRRALKASGKLSVEEPSINRTESVSVSSTVSGVYSAMKQFGRFSASFMIKLKMLFLFVDQKGPNKVEFEAKSARDSAWYTISFHFFLYIEVLFS